MLFWTFVIFCLFWILVGKFAFGPIKDALKKRENDIQSALDEAKKAKDEMAQLSSDNQKLLNEAREERAKLLREAKTTGFMTMCRSCNTPFPDSAKECPHCGTPAITEDETFSGFAVEPSRSWTYQLLGEVVERALDAGRSEEAARMFRRVAREIEVRLDQGDRLDPAQLETVCSYAVALANVDRATDWVAWMLDVYVRHDTLLSGALVSKLNDTVTLKGMASAQRYVRWARQSGLRGDSLDRLETFVSA